MRRGKRRSEAPASAAADPVARARAILAAGQVASPQALMQAIHLVNPTGTGRSREAAAELYELKSALQSLLVREYHDILSFDPAGGDTVSIRLDALERNACHARVDRLDPAARRIVLARLARNS